MQASPRSTRLGATRLCQLLLRRTTNGSSPLCPPRCLRVSPTKLHGLLQLRSPHEPWSPTWEGENAICEAHDRSICQSKQAWHRDGRLAKDGRPSARGSSDPPTTWPEPQGTSFSLLSFFCPSVMKPNDAKNFCSTPGSKRLRTIKFLNEINVVQP